MGMVNMLIFRPWNIGQVSIQQVPGKVPLCDLIRLHNLKDKAAFLFLVVAFICLVARNKLKYFLYGNLWDGKVVLLPC